MFYKPPPKINLKKTPPPLYCHFIFFAPTKKSSKKPVVRDGCDYSSVFSCWLRLDFGTRQGVGLDPSRDHDMTPTPNNALLLMVQKSGDHQLSLVVYPSIYKVLAPSHVMQDFFLQQY